MNALVRCLARCAAWSCLLASAVGAQPELPAETVAAVEEKVLAEQKAMGIPGLSVAVGWKGRIRYSNAFGQADVENGVAVTPETLFRTAAVAKPMTAVAVMQLVERGKIDLQQSALTYVPLLRLNEWPINLEQILCHQSGITHYLRPGEAAGTMAFASVTESVTMFNRNGLLHEPGTAFSYSTYGYTVLGAAIEAVTEAPYEDYMREHVWRAAGMEHTRIDHHYEVIPHRARGYQRASPGILKTLPEALRKRTDEGDLLRAPLHDTSMHVPGGGMLSTAEDLVRFGMAMLEDGRLVSAATRERMWTPAKTKSGEETRAGLGWFFFDTPHGRYVGHSGTLAGATCMLAIDQRTGVVAAVMTNLQAAGGVTFLATDVARLAAP